MDWLRAGLLLYSTDFEKQHNFSRCHLSINLSAGFFPHGIMFLYVVRFWILAHRSCIHIWTLVMLRSLQQPHASPCLTQGPFVFYVGIRVVWCCEILYSHDFVWPVVVTCIFCAVATHIEQLERHTKLANRRATWEAANGAESLVLQVQQFHLLGVCLTFPRIWH